LVPCEEVEIERSAGILPAAFFDAGWKPALLEESQEQPRTLSGLKARFIAPLWRAKAAGSDENDHEQESDSFNRRETEITEH
jgi:hypothetical protein